MRVGVAWPTPRFSDNGNGTVTHNLTGLVWLKKADSSVDTWAGAMALAANLASGSYGLTDGSVAGQWRLPTIKELSSLVDAGEDDPALPDDHLFTGVQSGYYWSSTPYTPNVSAAWYVHLNEGQIAAYDKTSSFGVWPVRGGP